MSGTDSHQGVMLEVEKSFSLNFKELLTDIESREEVRILFLDQVSDPHNLGAILRASECFGVDYVLASGKNVDITPVVTKVSVGASELVPFHTVGNLAEVIEKLKKAGCWFASADGGRGAENLKEFDFPKKTVLVLGSEGTGVRKLLLSRSDYTIKIPMYGQIDSLNVSQAAAVFLSAWR